MMRTQVRNAAWRAARSGTVGLAQPSRLPVAVACELGNGSDSEGAMKGDGDRLRH